MKKRIDSLQALRGVAILSLFFSHVGVINTGAWSVSVFFVLSGFSLTYSHYDSQEKVKPSLQGNLAFSQSKIKKLYPLHIVTMIFAVAYLIVACNESLQSIIKDIVVNILLIQSFIPKMYVALSLNSSAWFLSDCMFLYFVFPWLVYFLKRHSYMLNKLSQYLSVACVAFCVQLFLSFVIGRLKMPESYTNEWGKWFTYVFPGIRFVDFLVGAVFGCYFCNFSKKEESANIKNATFYESAVLLITLISIVICGKLNNGKYEWLRYTSLYLPSSAGVVLLMALNKGIISKIMTNKIIVWIGNLSPYIFLLNQVIIGWANYIIIIKNWRINIWFLGTIELLITLLISYAIVAFKDLYRKRKNMSAIY